MEIRFILKNKNYVSLFKDVYEKYAIYVDKIFMGYKYVRHDKDLVYVELHCPKYMRRLLITAMPYKIGQVAMSVDSVEFSTNKTDSMSFLTELIPLMEKAKKIYDSIGSTHECECIYSSKGDGNIDTAIYSYPNRYKPPYYIVNISQRTVTPCHGFVTNGGKEIAKKLGFEWKGI